MENLKDIWNNQDLSKDQVNSSDVSPMLKKKSSSVAKWILIVSIIEFTLPYLILLLGMDGDEIRSQYEAIGISKLMDFTTVLTVIISIGFIYQFYKNYKKINIDQSVADLMKSIVKTRDVVKTYIYYNLTLVSVLYIYILYEIFSSKEHFLAYFQLQSSPEIYEEYFWPILGVTTFFLSLVVLVLFLFYRFTYMQLLKRMCKNYTELRTQD